MNKKVLVFGYSDNPERYSYKAFNLLGESGFMPISFSPRSDDVSLFNDHYHTLTLYVGEEISNKFSDAILKLSFDRLIVNPGAENPDLERRVSEAGKEVIHGCTLVMLKTNQF